MALLKGQKRTKSKLLNLANTGNYNATKLETSFMLVIIWIMCLLRYQSTTTPNVISSK